MFLNILRTVLITFEVVCPLSLLSVTNEPERFVFESLSLGLCSSLDDSLLLFTELTDVRDSIRSLEEWKIPIIHYIYYQPTDSSVHLVRQYLDQPDRPMLDSLEYDDVIPPSPNTKNINTFIKKKPKFQFVTSLNNR